MRPKIAIETGTSYTKIYKSRADVVLYEPSVIAIKNGNYKKPIAIGDDAYNLIGKTQDGVKIIFPVNHTEIVDTKAYSAMVSGFINKIRKPHERISDVLFTVGCGTDREIIGKFEKALNQIGVYGVETAETSILSVLGADLSISESSCNALIDFGGGQTTICVLTANGVISGVSAGIGGNTLNKMIAEHVEKTLSVTLPDTQVEYLKKSVASLVNDDDTKVVVSGKDKLSGKNRSINVSASQILPPIKEFLDKIIEIVKMVFNKVPSESILEIQKNGVLLTGGGSKLYGLSDYLSPILGYKVQLVDEPDLSSIIGAGKLVEDKTLLNKLKLKV